METIIGNDIKQAQQFLQDGALVAIPTETVYGLAANAFDIHAVAKIFEVKQRPQFNPLIIHGASWAQLKNYVEDVPPVAEVLAQHFMPGPITFLLNKKSIVPDLVTAGSAKVAVRIPQHPLTLALLQQLDFPLAAPSANLFGYISPTTAQHVYEGLSGKIPYILDGGAAGVGVESTIIGFEANGTIVLHRSGGISVEKIEAVAQQKIKLNIGVEERPETPGQLKSHYAPHIPLYRGSIPQLIQQFAGKRIALLSFSNAYTEYAVAHKIVLSADGNVHEAAAQLFGALRSLDKLDVDVIITEIFPDEGIGRAINDRLKRAQAEFKL